MSELRLARCGGRGLTQSRGDGRVHVDLFVLGKNGRAKQIKIDDTRHRWVATEPLASQCVNGESTSTRELRTVLRAKEGKGLRLRCVAHLDVRIA
eukprot:scaffold30241_cov28-Tisochrysis_lutea.AAC.4